MGKRKVTQKDKDRWKRYLAAHPERGAKQYHANRSYYSAYAKSVKGRYSRARVLAKQKGREFSITFADYESLISLPCFYCGGPLNSTGVGLDRKDNSQGYSLENVVPCCRICNTTKGTRPFSVMLPKGGQRCEA